MPIQTQTKSPRAGSRLEPPSGMDHDSLAADYQRVRAITAQLCEPLSTEDYVVQSMSDVSPTKWHLAHATWFFETFVLQRLLENYRASRPESDSLFNSYYNRVGPPFPRPRRGVLSRPTVEEVFRYRQHVDQQVLDLLRRADADLGREISSSLELGLHHEQQHQELMLTDIKHVFSCNPIRPVYKTLQAAPTEAALSLGWLDFPEGLRLIGYDGEGFAYDNESPRHRAFIEAYRLATRLVTNGEYMDFITDGGYVRPELWLSDGWAAVQTEGWRAPLYWEKRDDRWWYMTLAGMREVEVGAPVCHVSYFEADAFARWRGVRLPEEPEWESAATAVVSPRGNFAEDGHLHPIPATALDSDAGLGQMFGDVWEWTRSPYRPYPGYRPSDGALGEYNAKFMCDQFVLRGGSCATSRSHIRPTYRNFFPPRTRWQFTGIRLAADADV